MRQISPIIICFGAFADQTQSNDLEWAGCNVSDHQEIVNNRYILEELIGRGAMGVVYRAHDRLTNKDVALKRLHPDWTIDPDASQLKGLQEYHMANLLALTQEFRILASLRHPNIISVLNYGIEDGQRPYFVMDYLPESQNLLQASQRETSTNKLNFIIQVLQALAYLHRYRILHRDLKMDNILVVDDTVQVLDFGLSIHVEQAQGQTGTWAYMAPETLQHGISTEVSDLYSVGVIAYEIFTNSLPYDEMDMLAILNQEPDIRMIDLPETLRNIFARLLLKTPAERYQSAEAVILALQEAMESPHGVETPKPMPVNYHYHTSFIGREIELQTLLTGLQKAKDGQGSLFLIGGEAGIGKSRLLAEVRTYALVEGIQVIYGAAFQGTTLPYRFLSDIVPQLAISTDLSAQEASILATIAPSVLQLSGHDSQMIPEGGGDAAQHRLVATFTSIFRRMNKPTVLLLEDIHWLKESMLVLQQVAKLVDEQGLVVIASYDTDDAPDLVEQFDKAQVLHLRPFVTSEIKDLSSMITGNEEQDILVEVLEEETEGKPQLIIDMLRMFIDQSELQDGDDKISELFVHGIQRMVDTQFKQSPTHLRPVLILAAALGRNIDKALLNTQFAPELLAEWIQWATEHGLLTILDERLFFAHERARLTFLETLSEEELKATYQQAAQAHEMLYADDEAYAIVLCEYWQKTGHDEKSCHYAQIAAKFGFAHGLLELAFSFSQRALALKEYIADDEQVIELELLLADIHTRMGNYDDAVFIYEAIRNRDDISCAFQAKALTSIGWIMHRRSHLQTAQDYCLQALEIAQESEDGAVISLSLKNLGFIMMNAAKFDEASDYFSKGLLQAQMIENTTETAALLNGLGLVYFIQGLHREASDYFEACLGYFELLDDRWNMAVALHNLGGCLHNMGEFDEAEVTLRRSLELDRSINDTIGIAFHLAYLIRCAVNQRNLHEASRYHDEIEQLLGKISDRKVEALLHRAVGWMHLTTDKVEASIPYLQAALDINVELAHKPSIVVSEVAFAWVAVLQKNWQKALKIFQEQLDIVSETGDFWSHAEILNGISLASYCLDNSSQQEAFIKQAMELTLKMAAMPLALETLMVLAIVRSKDNPVESMAYYHLVLNHPKARALTIQIAKLFIDDMEALLSPEDEGKAVELAAEMDVDKLIHGLAADEPIS